MPVAILVVGQEGPLHPAVAVGALSFSFPSTGEVGTKRCASPMENHIST